jgi:hypothetical protein
LDSVFIVRSDHSELLLETSGEKGGQVKLYITYCIWGRGLVLISDHLCGRGEEGNRERKQKVILGLSGL